MSAAEYWHSLLRPDVELSPSWWHDFAARHARRRDLTFGDRLNCPFLRPFFSRRRRTSRACAASPRPSRASANGSRHAADARAGAARTPSVSTDAERALVAIEPGYATASHGVAARLVPAARFALRSPSTTRSRPPVSATREVLAELFDDAADHGALQGAVRRAASSASRESILEALLASYREWGGTRRSAGRRHRRLA